MVDDPGEAVLAWSRDTTPTPSTWPWTTWPPSRSAARSGSSRFTVEPALDVAQRRAAQRLAHDVRAEALALAHADRGQADAVDGDRVALAELAARAATRRRCARRRRSRATSATFPRSWTSPVNTPLPLLEPRADRGRPRRCARSRASARAARRRCARRPRPRAGRGPCGRRAAAARGTAGPRRSRRRRRTRPPGAGRPRAGSR